MEKWSGWRLWLGIVWSSPITIVAAIFYVIPFTLIGWYRYFGIHEHGMFFVTTDKMPSWLVNFWKRWAGHTAGNIVVMTVEPTEKSATVIHELQHVAQCMKLGVFQPILYALSSLGIKLACPSSDPYFSNPFELDARRAAGQIVDVEGLVKKLHEKAAHK